MSYGVEALRATSGEGISGFSSRSDQARARETAKYGLTMQWYADRVQEQNNLCADCGKKEKRIGNGTNKLRPLGLGFGADGQPNRLICQLCASKQRRLRMEAKNAPKDFSSFEEFWEANREQLQKEDALQFATFRERDADTRELYSIICFYVRDYDGPMCYQLSDALNEVEAELVNHGTTDLDQLSAPFYKVEHRRVHDEIQAAAEALDAPKHARNCAVFAKYGWLQALPVSAGDHVVREFLRRNGRWPYPDWSKPPNHTRTIKCSTYHCPGEFTYDQRDRVPGWYFSTNINSVIEPLQWWCDSCRATQAALKPKGRTLAEVASDRIYTVEGEWRTPVDNPNTAWFVKLLPGA